MPGIEELLAQLYAQRGMQTMAESDAQMGAIVGQLQASAAQRAATTLGPRGRGPVRVDSAVHGAPVAQVSPYDNMPVLSGRHMDVKNNPEYDAQGAVTNDLSADIERGKAPTAQALQGLTPAEIGEAYNFGNRMHGYVERGADPSLEYRSITGQRAQNNDLVYRPEQAPQGDPQAGYIKRAEILDQQAQKHGGAIPTVLLQAPHPNANWTFEGSADSVYRNIADQLMARRKALGDANAFNAAFSQSL